MDIWLLEIGRAVGRFFLNPLLYVFILMAFLLGWLRIKKERHDFHARVYDLVTEVKHLFSFSMIIGLALSLILLCIGAVMSFGMVLLIVLISGLFALTLNIRWLSPAYVIGISLLLSLFLSEVQTGWQEFDAWIATIYPTSITGLVFLMALLLVAEGFLIVKNGSKQTSPQIKRSRRGKWIGLHESKRLWLVPIVLLVPGGGIPSLFEWWPLFSLGDTSFALFPIPYAIGFQQRVQLMLPKEAISVTGKRVFGLGLIMLLFALVSIWLPTLAIFTAVLAMIGREFITFKHRTTKDEYLSYFSKRTHGMVILGVIPKSPAEKMAVQVGEIITKVNGQVVRSEKDFYEALQANRAFCKLEVLDFNGEVRFVQRALYDGEHHELGLLFVHDEKDWGTKAV